MFQPLACHAVCAVYQHATGRLSSAQWRRDRHLNGNREPTAHCVPRVAVCWNTAGPLAVFAFSMQRLHTQWHDFHGVTPGRDVGKDHVWRPCLRTIVGKLRGIALPGR
jgi:hypothetical protein